MVREKLLQRRVVFLCDQTVEVHFPAHFSDVYLQLLPKRGWDVSLWAFALDTESTFSRSLKATKSVRLYHKRPGSLFGRIALSGRIPFVIYRWYKTMNLADSDIIVVHNDPVLGLIAWIWARKTNAALIFRVTHLIPESVAAMGSNIFYRTVANVAQYLRDWVMRRSDAVMPTSRAMACKLEKDSNIPGDIIHPLVATVNTRISASNGDGECLAAYDRVASQLSLHACDIWLTYLGTLDPQRRPSFLIDTIYELRAMGMNAGLLVLGVVRKQSHIKRLQDYAKDRRVEDCVVWSKPVPDNCIPSVLRLVHVGLCPFPIDPILRTNSPLKTLEYIRSGIPVVVSPVPDSIEVVSKSGAGVVAEYDAHSFAKGAFELASESKELRESRMQKAMAWLAANRDIDVACDLLIKTGELAVAHRRKQVA